MVERDRNTSGAGRSGQPSGRPAGQASAPGESGRASTSGGSGGATTPGGSGYEQASQLKEQVQEKATQVKEQVSAQATDKLSSQKDAASGSLNTVAHAFRQTSEQLRDNDQDAIAQYVDRAAGQVEQFAGYLGKSDIRGLARDTEAFARSEPALFLGGAFAVGLLAARFLKSTGQGGGQQGSNWQGQEEWYGRGGAAAGGVPQLPPRTGMGGGVAATASASQPASMTTGLGTSPATSGPGTGATPGTQPSGDVIVGGPPLPDDVIVGGPPREPGRGGNR